MTVLWLLAIFGFSVSIGFGQITFGFRSWLVTLGRPGRFFNELLSCPMCLSFWCGILLGSFVYSPCAEIWPRCSWLLDGFLAAGSTILVYSLLSMLNNAAAVLEDRAQSRERIPRDIPSGTPEGSPREDKHA